MDKIMNRLMGICMCLIILIVIGSCSPAALPEEIVNNFLFYMTNFEQQRAYDFLAKEFKEELRKNKINRESFMGYLPSPFGTPLWMGDEFSLAGKTIYQNGIARVKVELRNPVTKQAVAAECQLKIEDTEWRISSLDLPPNTNVQTDFDR